MVKTAQAAATHRTGSAAKNSLIFFVMVMSLISDKDEENSGDHFHDHRNFGRSGGSRTHGLLDPNQARYQLRYTPIQLIHYTEFQ